MSHVDAELVEEDRAEDMRFLLGNHRGRAFLWDTLARCNVFGASFTAEPLTTAFNEGRRHIGIQLLQDILTADPAALEVMKGENAARSRRYHVKSTDEGEFE